VWNLEKIINFHKEIHIERLFFDNKNSI
jgi:hypothetical protein